MASKAEDKSKPDTAAQMQPMFYVTRKSQVSREQRHKKLRYVGIRNLSDLDKIQEEDIIGPKGTIRGVKNRVRAGLANFQNPAALWKVSKRLFPGLDAKRGGAAVRQSPHCILLGRFLNVQSFYCMKKPQVFRVEGSELLQSLSFMYRVVYKTQRHLTQLEWCYPVQPCTYIACGVHMLCD